MVPWIWEKNKQILYCNNGSSRFWEKKIFSKFIIKTAGNSHYDIQQQPPFVAKQNDEHFGFEIDNFN